MDNSPPPSEHLKSISQLLRYALIGITSNAIGYIFYLSLTYFGATPIFTMSLVYGVSATIGYIGNRNVTFSYKGSTLGSGIRYFIAHTVGYLINLSMMIIFVEHLDYPHQGVQAVAILFVAGFLFITFKLFVFQTLSTKPSSEKI